MKSRKNHDKSTPKTGEIDVIEQLAQLVAEEAAEAANKKRKEAEAAEKVKLELAVRNILFKFPEVPNTATILESVMNKISRNAYVGASYKEIELNWLAGKTVEYRSQQHRITPNELNDIFNHVIAKKKYMLLEVLLNNHECLKENLRSTNHEDLLAIFNFMLSKKSYANHKVFIWDNCRAFVTWVRADAERLQSVLKASLTHAVPAKIATDIWVAPSDIKRIFIIKNSTDIIQNLLRLPETVVREIFQFDVMIAAVRSTTDEVLARVVINYLYTNTMNLETNAAKFRILLQAVNRKSAIENMLERQSRTNRQSGSEGFCQMLTQRLQELDLTPSLRL